MTDQPPPPPGNYPPPPPPGGYPPPPAQGGGFAPPPQAATGYPPSATIGGLPPEAYTPWFTRVLAYIIDYIPVAILEGIGVGLLLGTRETVCITDSSEYDLGDFCATGASTLGQVSFGVAGILLPLIYIIWNLGYRQGATGSSIGKGIMKFKIISEKTGQPIGFGMSVVRELLYMVASGVCGILWVVAVLFPLWDQKRQTLVDKIISTIALPI
jgi:uncharacterized RDD family membrane protein YckC